MKPTSARTAIISTLRSDRERRRDPKWRNFLGTLSYWFTFDGTVPFSTLVRDAHRLGYTGRSARGPDRRDVARKLPIPASNRVEDGARRRHVDSLVPRGLVDGPFSPPFFSSYAAHDAQGGGACGTRGTGARCCVRGDVRARTLEPKSECLAIRPFAATKGATTSSRSPRTGTHRPLIVQIGATRT